MTEKREALLRMAIVKIQVCLIYQSDYKFVSDKLQETIDLLNRLQNENSH